MRLKLKLVKQIYSSENGYSVINCDAINEKGKVAEYDLTLTGFLLPSKKNAVFEAEVEKVNTKYGEQYKVHTYEEKDPEDDEGIVALILASKLRGIGKKKAQKIVQKFGQETLYVLDNEFERLKEIKGFPTKNLKIAEKQWKDSRELRELMVVVGNSTNISQNKLLKIKRYFKEDTLKILKKQPYEITKVKGITFSMADSLARKNPLFDSNDEERIGAGIKQALVEAMERGHLFLLSEELIANAYRLLNINVSTEVSANSIKAVCNNLCTKGEIVASRAGTGENEKVLIYLFFNFKNEVETAKKIAELLKNSSNVSEETILKVVEDVEKQEGVILAKGQKKAVINAIKYRVSIITGGPGTGKTTTLNVLLKTFRKIYPAKSINLMAPTGRAARRMAETTKETASTIHSALGLRNDEDEFNVETNIKDLVVIDEMSMCDMKIFHQLCSSLTKHNRFVMVGDVDQLPSVGAGNVFSELIKSEIIPTTVLDKPFRQAEGDLIYINASKINQGKCDLEYGMDFEFIPAHGEKEISDICCKKYSEIVEKNAGNLDSVALLTPFRKKTKIGANEINLTIRDKVNLNSNKTIVNAGSISYMLGDKVMQLKNITEDGISLSNGDIGYVKALATGTENDAYVVVEYSEIGEKTYKTHDDFEMLDLAYASTVHKAQGSEVDYVIMPVSKIFKVLLKRNIIYTGISRAKKGVILVGDKVSLEAAIKDNTYANRNTILGVRIRQEVNKKEGQMAFDFDSI